MGYSSKEIDREVYKDVAETCPKADAELEKAADEVIDLLYEAYEIEWQDYGVSVPLYAAIQPELQPAEQPVFTVGTDLSDGELSVVVMKHENDITWVIHSEVIPLAQQPLTDEHKAILKECHNQAMEWVLKARIPESGVFGGIAQDLDYLCEQLGVEND